MGVDLEGLSERKVMPEVMDHCWATLGGNRLLAELPAQSRTAAFSPGRK